MAVYLSETVVTERALAAGVNGPFDLPVNPISFVLLHMRWETGLNPADYQQILAAFDNITITFKGTSILNMNGVDLARMVQFLWGMGVNIENFNQVTGNLGSITLPIPFTRVPFWMNEAFPATRRGELVISITRPAAVANLTNPVFAVETVTLLEADPTQFIKLVTLSRAVAIGDADMELPIGNPFLGMQIFAPTAMGVAPISESIRRYRLMLDNVEFNIGDASFDAHRAISFLRAGGWNDFIALPSLARNYNHVDFDPLKDEGYLVETEGRASVRLRFVPDVATTVRVTPIELVRLAGGAAPGVV